MLGASMRERFSPSGERTKGPRTVSSASLEAAFVRTLKWEPSSQVFGQNQRSETTTVSPGRTWIIIGPFSLSGPCAVGRVTSTSRR